MEIFGLGYLVVQLAIRDGVPHLAPVYIGLVGLSRAIPGLSLGLFGGVVADRVDRRQLLRITQSCASVVAMVLGVLALTGQINIVQVVLLGLIQSTLFSFDAPARQAMVPRLVGERQLMSAIGLSSVTFNGAHIVGPILGGLLIPFGVGWLFIVNSISYVAVVAALSRMASVPMAGNPQRVSMLQSIREGLGYIRGDPVVRWIVLLAALSALLVRPYLQLMPAFAEEVLRVGAVELSWLLSASGVGAFAGAVATAAMGGLQNRGRVLLASAFGTGALVSVFALQTTLVGSLPILALAGFSTMLFMGMANTLLQSRTPDRLRGRVMSVHTMVFIGVMPLGTMLLGAIGAVAGTATGLLLGGIAVSLIVIYATLRVAPLRTASSPAAAEPASRARA